MRQPVGDAVLRCAGDRRHRRARLLTVGVDLRDAQLRGGARRLRRIAGDRRGQLRRDAELHVPAVRRRPGNGVEPAAPRSTTPRTRRSSTTPRRWSRTSWCTACRTSGGLGQHRLAGVLQLGEGPGLQARLLLHLSCLDQRARPGGGPSRERCRSPPQHRRPERLHASRIRSVGRAFGLIGAVPPVRHPRAQRRKRHRDGRWREDRKRRRRRRRRPRRPAGRCAARRGAVRRGL